MTTIEGNKLIAKFRGLEIITDGISFFDTNYDALKNYRESWDSLMPVIFECEDRGLNFKYSGGTIEFWSEFGNNGKIITLTTKGIGWTPETANEVLHNAWTAVITFIEWYNKQQ